MGEQQTQKNSTMTQAKEELKKMTDTGFPMLAMGLAAYLKNMIIVACMGRLGSLELAGGALAIGFTNITGYSVLSGLAMGMEPLCSQAYGSKKLTIVSRTLQRTIIMLLFASLPIGMLWFYLEPLMLLLHQSPDILHVASIYCRYAIPDLFANSLLHPIRIYLRSKGTTWPLLWSASLAIILHIPITIFLTFYLSLGVQGIAVSSYIVNFNTLILLIGYILYTRVPEEPIFKPLVPTLKLLTSEESLGNEWGVLVRLSIPSCLSVCLEWWWYELMTLLAGYLDRPEAALATSAIVIQTTSLLYALPSALSSSISARVGNELGAGRPSRARIATLVAIVLAFLTSSFGFLLTTLGKDAWVRVFTTNSEVLELSTAVLPIIGLCELANCPQTTCCGVLRGCARTSVGAAVNFFSFYLMGTPVAIYLCFIWKLGFMGLCYGLLAAQVVCVVSLLAVIHNMNWERESLKAKNLVGHSNEYSGEDRITKCEEGHVHV